jgi:transcriptional regulator with PAS, ATPase and Fis domain
MAQVGLTSILDTLHEGIILLDDLLYVKHINKRACMLLNTTEKEIKRRPLFLFCKDFAQSATCLGHHKPIRDYIFKYGQLELVAQFEPLEDLEGDAKVAVVINDLQTHQKLRAKTMDDAFYYDVLDIIMNNTNEWIVIVDKNGIITAMSRAYKDFLETEFPEGKHVSEVIENTRMHHVIESGLMETGEIQSIRGNKMIASRVPIVQNGKVVGAVGKAIFKDIDDFYTLFNKLSKNQKGRGNEQREHLGLTPSKFSFQDISGNSKHTRYAIDLAQKAAKTDSNVLIVGASGTGKELFAHAIHGASKRRTGPFVMINCAAIPSELLESELFGYVHGAFTGANKQGRKGRFELAQKGTIFLDEIGDMPLEMQAKLLRVLQAKEIDRVGGDEPIPIDVRVIAATNRDLEQLVASERFRKDLYYRLNVMRINLVPLALRSEEIPEIASDILSKLTEQMGLIVHGFTPAALEAICRYEWPGNIRELENVLERALNLLDDDLYIKESILPEAIVPLEGRANHSEFSNTLLYKKTELMEKTLIEQALSASKGNKKKAAEALGISRAGL